MKAIVRVPQEINVKYLDVYPGGRFYIDDICIDDDDFDDWEEVEQKYPSLFCPLDVNSKPEFYLKINVDNGKVENWPEGKAGYFDTVKIVDEGTYVLKDEDNNEVVKYQNYVLDCLQINRDGYGDYFEFNINKQGYIEDWEFGQKDVNELFEIFEDEDC